ncbi:Hypothetical protein LUCI_3162 [Lucifera butyrica]|uniref:Phage tail collar domain-containing protein n=2 Tax=Lucifera butyrica TaxID=1351585 RepID=A0A498RAD1_9FIRM|nr:Hypothetical protein LUCI_3162 [Lucifera butyrica]
MARTFTCNEEIIVVSKGAEDTGKLAMLGYGGKFDPSVIPEIQPSIPAGVVMHFAAATPPKGWLKADGSAIARTDYADLFAVVGTAFGTGDGSTTFNLPDLRGEFIRGFDDGRGVDSSRVLGSNQSDAFASHTHPYYYMTPEIPSDGDYGVPGNSTGTHRQKTSLDTSASGGSETRPRNVALLVCIKY